MKYEIPNIDNPFEEQRELATAWELGWHKRNEDFISHIGETSRWSIEFRQAIRSALFPYYPNNPCSTDDELIDAIKGLVDKATKKRVT